MASIEPTLPDLAQQLAAFQAALPGSRGAAYLGQRGIPLAQAQPLGVGSACGAGHLAARGARLARRPRPGMGATLSLGGVLVNGIGALYPCYDSLPRLQAVCLEDWISVEFNSAKERLEKGHEMIDVRRDQSGVALPSRFIDPVPDDRCDL
jgi:hypothetical protein